MSRRRGSVVGRTLTHTTEWRILLNLFISFKVKLPVETCFGCRMWVIGAPCRVFDPLLVLSSVDSGLDATFLSHGSM